MVIMDITMPNMDGLQALKKIRENHPDAKIVMCTAMGQESMVVDAIKSGANAARGRGISSRGVGVRVADIVEDDREMKMVYNPEHPDADENGFVEMPNVDLLKETADAMAATRSYDANVTALNAVKLMAQKALEIGK